MEDKAPPEPKNLPGRQSKRRRKRLRLIADDSVFIPISDSMMENVISGNKENVDRTPSLPKSVPVEQSGNRVEEDVEVSIIFPCQ